MFRHTALYLLIVLALGRPAAGCPGGEDAGEVDPQTSASEPARETPPYLFPQRGTAALNERLKPWVTVSGEFRFRGEGRTAEQFRPGRDDFYGLTRLRVDVDARPAPWLRLFLQGQDSQALGLNPDPDPPVFEDTFDLREAYAEIFHRSRQGFGLRVGRQELRFGDERLVGAFNWGNTSRTFDAARFFHAGPKHRIDFFVSSVVVIEDGVFNRLRDGANLHGIYGSFQGAVPQATVDVYWFWRTLQRVRSERGFLGDADVHTVGTRWAGKLPQSFDYRLEVAGQGGDFAGDDVSAWALHSQLGHTWAGSRRAPRLLIEYNYSSGDENPTDGRRGTFDQLFPTNHDKYGIADQIGWRNIHDLRAGIGFRLSERVTGQLDYHSFWLASRRDALYSAPGVAVARVPGGARSGHVGQEIDADFRITLTKYLSLWTGVAGLFAGDFLSEATPGSNTGFYYFMLIYRF